MRASYTGPRPDDRVLWSAEVEDNSREETFMTGQVLRVRGEPEIELALYALSPAEFYRVLDTVNAMRGGPLLDSPLEIASGGTNTYGYTGATGMPEPPTDFEREELRLKEKAGRSAEMAGPVRPIAPEPEPTVPGVRDRFSGLDIA